VGGQCIERAAEVLVERLSTHILSSHAEIMRLVLVLQLTHGIRASTIFFCFVFYMHRKGFCAEISKETARLSPEFYSYTSCRRASRTSAIFGHSLGSYGRGRVNKRSPPRLATPRRASGSDSVPFRKPLRNLKMNYFLFVAGHERAYRNRNLTAFAYGNTVDVIVQMKAILI